MTRQAPIVVGDQVSYALHISGSHRFTNVDVGLRLYGMIKTNQQRKQDEYPVHKCSGS